MDLRVGGELHLIWRNSTLTKGDVAPPAGFGDANGESLAFTWAHTGDPETEATFELTPRGDEVDLVITHRRLRTDGLIPGLSAGWHAHPAGLAARLADTEPPKFWETFGRLRKA